MYDDDDDLLEDTPQSDATDKFKALMAVVVALVYIGGMLLLIIIWAALPLAEQFYIWLRYGVFPPRDIFWLIAPSDCNFFSTYDGPLSGKDFCRAISLDATNWVGLNRVLNYLADTHVGVYAVLACFFIWSTMEPVTQSIGEAIELNRDIINKISPAAPKVGNLIIQFFVLVMLASVSMLISFIIVACFVVLFGADVPTTPALIGSLFLGAVILFCLLWLRRRGQNQGG